MIDSSGVYDKEYENLAADFLKDEAYRGKHTVENFMHYL
jgi:hypothetical protein